MIRLYTEALNFEKELKKKSKIENGTEAPKISRTKEQVIQEIYDYIEDPYHSTLSSKLWISSTIKDEKNQKLNLINEIQEKLFKNVEVVLKVLGEFLDNEYYELIKFLTLKKEKNYLIWIILEIIVFAVLYTISLLVYFFLEINFFLFLNRNS